MHGESQWHIFMHLHGDKKVGSGIANAKMCRAQKPLRYVPGFSAPTCLQPKVWTTMKRQRAYPPLHVFKELTLTNLFFLTYTPLRVFKELTSTKNVFSYLVCCVYYVPRTYYVQVLGSSHFSGLGVERVIINKYMYNPWHKVLKIRDLVLTLDLHLKIIIRLVWIVNWVLTHELSYHLGMDLLVRGPYRFIRCF
jgi:hypothetical protein